MSNPMIGDSVWYHPAPTDPLAHFGKWPLAAIVVCVYDEGNVNLSVFDPEGVACSRVSVWPEKEGEMQEGYFEERSKPFLTSAPKKKHK